MREIKPSHYLPDYLKSDLSVGELGQHPLLKALDLFAAGLANRCLQATSDLLAQGTSREIREQALARLGLKHETLNAVESNRLYELRVELFAAVGTLRPVCLLGELYFPGATVDQGLPYAHTRVSQTTLHSLSDVDLGRNTLFVRAVNAVDAARAAEFVFNAQKLVPVPYRVRLAPPKAQPTPVMPWRVECRISRK